MLSQLGIGAHHSTGVRVTGFTQDLKVDFSEVYVGGGQKVSMCHRRCCCKNSLPTNAHMRDTYGLQRASGNNTSPKHVQPRAAACCDRGCAHLDWPPACCKPASRLQPQRQRTSPCCQKPLTESAALCQTLQWAFSRHTHVAGKETSTCEGDRTWAGRGAEHVELVSCAGQHFSADATTITVRTVQALLMLMPTAARHL